MNINKNLINICISILLLLPLMVMGAGFQINEINPRSQGQATAGSGSSVDDVSAIFNNPALLATLKRNQIYLGASYIAPNIRMEDANAVHTTYIPGPPAPTPVPTTITGAAKQNNIADSALAPNVYASYRLSNALVAGLSINTPWGLTTQYDANSTLRFMAQKTGFKTINVTPALAMKINPKISLGIGLQAQYAEAEFSSFNGSALIHQTTSPTHLKGHAWGYGYNIGILLSPNKTTVIGVSYRSQINYSLRGNGEQYVVDGPIQPATIPNAPFNSDTNVIATMNTPAVLNISLTHKINTRWEVSTTEQLTFWSSERSINITMPQAYMKKVSIKMNWKNSWLYTLGTQYTYNNRWQFRTGIAFDQTPTNDINRDARIPDANRYWLTMGASYHINNRLRIDAAYEHIFMNNQHINLTQQVGGSSATKTNESNTVRANYFGNANIFALGLNWSF